MIIDSNIAKMMADEHNKKMSVKLLEKIMDEEIIPYAEKGCHSAYWNFVNNSLSSQGSILTAIREALHTLGYQTEITINVLRIYW